MFGYGGGMTRAGRLVAVLLLAAAAGGCGESPTPETPVAAVRTGPLTPTDPGRVPPTAAAAIAALAAVASPDPPAGEHHGHSQVGPQEFAPLDPPEQALLDEQWAEALAAVPGLDSVAEAESAGYLRAAAQGAGVGVHYVKWELIDQPFDPAAPSMLLFDERDGPLQGDLVGCRSPTR